MFVSLWINIIVVNSHKTPKTDVLSGFDAVYFDASFLNEDLSAKINQVVNSNKSAVFSKMLNQKDPVLQFYGLAGFMKSNQKSALNFINDMLVSSKILTVYFAGKKIETTLGYAVLLLLKEMPEELTNKPIDDFYSLTEDKIYNAYNSSLFKNDPLYNQALTQLIGLKYTELSKKIYKETVSFDNLKSKSLEEKIKLSTMLSTAPIDKREKILTDLLQEKNDKISLNVLTNINETDSLAVSGEIYKILQTSVSSDVLKLAVKKYSLISKKSGIPSLELFLKSLSPSKDDLVLLCLEQIYNYGNESDYEFLKMFLETNYSQEINLYALKTMIQTTYAKNPSNVTKTFLYIIRYYGVESVVAYTIKFFIDNGISSYTDMIISRVSKQDSVPLKKVGIDYIERFKLKDYAKLLETFSNDIDPEIRERASKVLLKLQSETQGL